MKTLSQNPFHKSPPPAIASVARLPELQARADRIWKIIELASFQAPDKHRKKLIKLARSSKMRRELELIDRLPDEQFAQFLDMLEAGTPEEFRHMLEQEKGL